MQDRTNFDLQDLARISLRPGPLYINVDYRQEHSTVEGLEQGYVICDSDKRFLLLFSFLKKNLKKKVCDLLERAITTLMLIVSLDHRLPFVLCVCQVRTPQTCVDSHAHII